jgi:hypothetical protein
MTKILVITGAAVLALAGLCGGAWAFGKAVAGHQTETHAVTGPVRSVVVDVDRGDVRLTPGTAVSVEQTRRWDLKKPRVTRTLHDGVLTVKSRCHGVWVLSHCATDLDVSIPAGVAVRVQTNVGDVSGHGLVTRDARVRTDVGDVHVGLAQAPGRLAAETNVGDISLSVPHGRYAVRTVSHVGDDRVDGLVQDDSAPASIRAITDVGDVAVASTP